MKNRVIKQIILSFTVFFMLIGCGGDGKNGAASDSNLLSDDYIFIEPIPEPEPTPPEPTPPEPTPPGPTPPGPTPPGPTPPEPTPPEPTPPEPGNTAPIANAGQDKEVGISDTVILDGSGSYDADGDPLSYRWRMVEIPSGSTANLLNTSSINPSFVTDLNGYYRIDLIVNDGKVDSPADSVFITIDTLVPDNTPPTAVIEGPLTVIVQKLNPTKILLDGTKSYDDGLIEPLTYTWISGHYRVPGSQVHLTTSCQDDYSACAHSASSVVCRYTIDLEVFDGEYSDLDSIDINVDYSACLEEPTPKNTPPTAVAKGSKTVIVKWGEKHEAILDGSKSFDDGLINPLTYSWKSGPYIVNEPIIRATPSCSDDWQRCYNADQRPICSFDITLTVFDGEFSDTDTSNLKVDYSECEHEPIVTPDSIHLDPAYQQTIPKTKHKTYKLWAYYEDSSTKDVTTDAVLSTSNTNIAVIDANGKVTGISAGDVLIIADYAGQRDTAPLTVTD